MTTIHKIRIHPIRLVSAGCLFCNFRCTDGNDSAIKVVDFLLHVKYTVSYRIVSYRTAIIPCDFTAAYTAIAHKFRTIY